jgi:hypothetical protein
VVYRSYKYEHLRSKTFAKIYFVYASGHVYSHNSSSEWKTRIYFIYNAILCSTDSLEFVAPIRNETSHSQSRRSGGRSNFPDATDQVHGSHSLSKRRGNWLLYRLFMCLIEFHAHMNTGPHRKDSCGGLRKLYKIPNVTFDN